MKNSVRLASLVLFLAIFAPGVVLGMKELPEQEPQILGEETLPQLPPDVRRIIANKTLRLILDEAEDKPEMLMEPQKNWSGTVLKLISSLTIGHAFYQKFLSTHGRTHLIDFVILLIENGADPTIKNYKGDTVLDLLFAGFVQKVSGPRFQKIQQEEVRTDYENYIEALKLKIDLLSKRKALYNENVPNLLIMVALNHDLGPITWSFFYWLKKSLGMDFTAACQSAKKMISQGSITTEWTLFPRFCSGEKISTTDTWWKDSGFFRIKY